jgi:hypothetical protein
MPHVGGEQRKPCVDVDSLPIPLGQAMDREGVTKVVWPRPDAPAGRLESKPTQQPPHRIRSSLHQVGPAIRLHQEGAVGCGVGDGFSLT